MVHIKEIAFTIGPKDDELELYGNYKAKVDIITVDRFAGQPGGRLILVTAINPTPTGEGMTTTSVRIKLKFHMMNAILILHARIA